jgi:Transposase DDE domain group 1
LLTQEVYQLLAGYPDGNDAQQVRRHPLFQTLVDVPPDAEQPLASGSTVNRFHHAYTRRQAELPLEQRPVLGAIDAARTQRLQLLHDYLPELFIQTPRTPRPWSSSMGIPATIRRRDNKS